MKRPVQNDDLFGRPYSQNPNSAKVSHLITRLFPSTSYSMHYSHHTLLLYGFLQAKLVMSKTHQPYFPPAHVSVWQSMLLACFTKNLLHCTDAYVKTIEYTFKVFEFRHDGCNH